MNTDEKDTLDIQGYTVTIEKVEQHGSEWYNAYAKLPNSRYLSDNYLMNPSFRGQRGFFEGNPDEIGVDTNQAWDQDTPLDRKYARALSRISALITLYRSAMEEGYVEPCPTETQED